MPYWPYIVIPIGVIGLCGAVVACIYFGSDTWKVFSKTVFGSRRLLTLYSLDIVHKFSPEDKPQDWDELPRKITQAEIIKAEQDASASTELERACRDAFGKGRIHLVSVHFA